MAYTEGPYAYGEGSNIYSLSEFEEWSMYGDGEREPKRVLCVMSAMGGEDSNSDLALFVAAPELLEMNIKLLEKLEAAGLDPELAAEAREIIDRAQDYKKMKRM